MDDRKTQAEIFDRQEFVTTRAIFEAVRIGIEKKPNLKVQPVGELGLAVRHTQLSITVSARMSSDGQQIMVESQRPDELTGILRREPGTIEIRLADETPHFEHKSTQLDSEEVARLLIKVAEGSGGLRSGRLKATLDPTRQPCCGSLPAIDVLLCLLTTPDSSLDKSNALPMKKLSNKLTNPSTHHAARPQSHA